MTQEYLLDLEEMLTFKISDLVTKTQKEKIFFFI